MQRNILILIFVLCAFQSIANNTKKYIPYWRSLNAQKLSFRLTHHLSTDSEKIEAIHFWIAHHIKYNYKKSATFNYNRDVVKKILRSRKAVCLGYSDLFIELCNYAGIKSTYIPGYVKNEHTDIHDKFYLDEHIWNAVLLNNKWQLIDVCWDAGYIKYTKSTFKGKILKVLTRGKKDIIKFKPHFVKMYSRTFVLKDGNSFISTHLPANPIWQLLSPQYTLNEIENDSSFYFNRPIKQLYQYDNMYEIERNNLINLNYDDRQIKEGQNIYKFNKRNQFYLGNAFSIKAFKLFTLVKRPTIDTMILLLRCDSLLKYRAISKKYFDSTLLYLACQKNELTDNNNLKKQIMLENYNASVSSTLMAKSYISKGIYLSKNGKNLVKKILKYNSKNLTRLHRSDRYIKTIPLKKINKSDSLNSIKNIQYLNDSLNKYTNILKHRLQILDSLYNVVQHRLRQYSIYSNLNGGNTYYNELLRLSCEDDLDYLVYHSVTTLQKHKFKDDSTLLFNDNKFVIESFYQEVVQLKIMYTQLYKIHKSIDITCCKLKKNSKQLSECNAFYKSNLLQFNNEIKILDRSAISLINEFQILKKYCKHQNKETAKELSSYKSEMNVEQKLNSFRTSYINRHYSALANNIKKQLQKLNTLQVQTLNIKTHYTINK